MIDSTHLKNPNNTNKIYETIMKRLHDMDRQILLVSTNMYIHSVHLDYISEYRWDENVIQNTIY